MGVEGGVHIGQHTGRQRPLSNDDVMLKMCRQIGASGRKLIEPPDIGRFGVRTSGVVGDSAHGLPCAFLKGFAELGRENAFVPYLGSECRAASLPFHPVVQSEGIGVDTVEILASGLAPVPLVMVVPTVPAHGRCHVQASGHGIHPHGAHPPFVTFPLVSACTAVKCVRFVRFIGISQLCINTCAVACGHRSLPESSGSLKGAVGCSAVAACISSAEVSGGSASGCRYPQPCISIAIHTAGGGNGGSTALVAGDDVHHSGESCRTCTAGRCTLEHFYALDVDSRQGEVGRKMSRMGRSDVDTVEHDGHLVEGASTHTDVGLHAMRSALPHIHCSRKFYDVTDGLCSRRGNVGTGDDRHTACSQSCRHGGMLRQCHGLAQCQGLIVQGYAVCLCTGALGKSGTALRRGMGGSGHRQGGYRQHADLHILSQRGKKRPALASKMAEDERRTSLSCVFVLHKK